MRNKGLVLALIIMGLFIVLCGCGALAPEPTPKEIPTVETTLPPTPEPVLAAGYAVTVDGKELASGSYMMDDTACVSLDEVAEAMGVELVPSQNTLSFQWRGDTVQIRQNRANLTRAGKVFNLPCKTFTFHGDTYIPLESFCDILDISLLYDEEYDRMYCTPGAGDWELPVGYRVPVFMYHCVKETYGADLYVNPDDMEDQIVYLLENGYDPIWFEDLEHVEDYDKPVIFVFDDGYDNNYEYLYPLVLKYNVKVSICMITAQIDEPGYLYKEQLQEMTDSGLVMIESHTVNHAYLDALGTRRQIEEMEQSKLDITRVTGKEPVMLCYPSGCANSITSELLPDYYRFGLKMTGPCYVTGDDPTMIWRIFIKGTDGLIGFVNRLNYAYTQRQEDWIIR